jgi:hypothetical protein
MVENNGDRRKWHRESLRIPARYFIKDSSSRFQDCMIQNISRGGVSVLLPGYEFIQEKGLFYLDFIVPNTVQQLNLRGQVRMQRSQRGGLIAGIQFDKLLPEATFKKLAGRQLLKGWLASIQPLCGQTATAAGSIR